MIAILTYGLSSLTSKAKKFTASRCQRGCQHSSFNKGTLGQLARSQKCLLQYVVHCVQASKLPEWKWYFDKNKLIRVVHSLIHWPLFRRQHFQIYFLEWKFSYSKISLKIISEVPIDIKSALVQIMAWRRTGDKPLAVPILAYVTDVFIHHLASMS